MAGPPAERDLMIGPVGPGQTHTEREESWEMHQKHSIHLSVVVLAEMSWESMEPQPKHALVDGR